MPFSHFCPKWENTPKCSWDFSELVLGSFPEEGVPSTSHLPEVDHPVCIMGFLENPHRYWTSCIDESEVRIKPSEKQKSRRRALKCSQIDFEGTHVVYIGVPSKSRQNAIFWVYTDEIWIRVVGHGWYPTKRLQKFGREIGTHGMQSEIHRKLAGNRNSWNAVWDWIHRQWNRNSWNAVWVLNP